MSKKNNNSELLIRIDERVKVLPQIKQDIRDIKDKVNKHETRITLVEEAHKKPWKFGSIGLILRLLGLGK